MKLWTLEFHISNLWGVHSYGPLVTVVLFVVIAVIVFDVFVDVDVAFSVDACIWKNLGWPIDMWNIDWEFGPHGFKIRKNLRILNIFF